MYRATRRNVPAELWIVNVEAGGAAAPRARRSDHQNGTRARRATFLCARGPMVPGGRGGVDALFGAECKHYRMLATCLARSAGRGPANG